eukprot:SAG31_NODE_46621_length_253_cov_1.331169_1_plen_35_part_01
MLATCATSCVGKLKNFAQLKMPDATMVIKQLLTKI